MSAKVTASNSLFQTAPTGTVTGTGNLTGVNPLLATAGLQNNGGPTQTVGLQAGSPAIGKAGNPDSLITDRAATHCRPARSISAPFRAGRRPTRRPLWPRSLPPPL